MKKLSEALAPIINSFPVPDYLSLRPVGIDISPKAVRVLTLKRTKAGRIPEFYEEKLLKDVCPVLQSDEDVQTCDELRAALVELKEKHQIDFATVSLPEVKTFIFKTTIPQEALETIDDALVVKIQENVPLETSKIIYDYTVLPLRRGGEIGVVVTVFPRNVIAAYTKLFDEVGIIPVAFETESQSIARSVVAKKDMGPYLLINLGWSRVNLAIVEYGVVHYTTSISYNPEELLKDKNGVEAIALKRKINQLLVYWFTNNRDGDDKEKITTAIATGPYAMDDGIIQYLEESAHIIISPANVWQNCFELNKHIPEISRKESLNYATSVGLALINQ